MLIGKVKTLVGEVKWKYISVKTSTPVLSARAFLYGKWITASIKTISTGNGSLSSGASGRRHLFLAEVTPVPFLVHIVSFALLTTSMGIIQHDADFILRYRFLLSDRPPLCGCVTQINSSIQDIGQMEFQKSFPFFKLNYFCLHRASFLFFLHFPPLLEVSLVCFCVHILCLCKKYDFFCQPE